MVVDVKYLPFSVIAMPTFLIEQPGFVEVRVPDRVGLVSEQHLAIEVFFVPSFKTTASVEIIIR